MDIYYHIEDFKIKDNTGTVLAIGNFDGGHPGHRKILRKTVQEARKAGLLSGVFTFKIHPKNLIGCSPVKYITGMSQKMDFFRDMGLSFCVIADVKKKFLNTEPEIFIKNILKDILRVRVLVVGKNFHFGRNAKASVNELYEMQDKYGFRLITIPLIEYKHETISSTRIRNAIDMENFNLANRLLGKNLFYAGKVVTGRRLGTQLGFPTANIRCREMNSLEPGIYAVRIWLEGRRYFGVMNSGFGPTIQPSRKRIHEIHILDFENRMLYGKAMAVEPFEKIRDELRFDTKDALIQQIKSDIKCVTQMINKSEI